MAPEGRTKRAMPSARAALGKVRDGCFFKIGSFTVYGGDDHIEVLPDSKPSEKISRFWQESPGTWA